MHLKPYDPKVSVPCFIQFDGCEPEEVDRIEQRAALYAAVLTREPCTTWDHSGISGKRRYEPGNELSTNIAKAIAKAGLSERATRLALEMETCRIDADADDLPMEFSVDMVWRDDYPPYVSLDEVVEIYPEFSGVAFGRIGCFKYSVICGQTGHHIAECRTRDEALVAAALEAFEFRTRTVLGNLPHFTEVPEAA